MELKIAQSGVVYYTSSKLNCPNAFFTRQGGISKVNTASLNLAYGRGDSRETVRENLSLCGEALNFDPSYVVSCPQIHSTKILRVTKKDRGLGYERDSEGYDGYITDEDSVVLGVKTADCVPILFSAHKGGKAVAVAAVHAGWRGTVARIAKNAVRVLTEYGVSPEKIYAAIGPCAGPCCYEVGEEVFYAARENFTSQAISASFRETGREGYYFVDLKALNASILYECGIPYENMDISEMCTICEPSLFYSHRRDGEARGTHLNVIFLN